jgi:hypothetical protein
VEFAGALQPPEHGSQSRAQHHLRFELTLLFFCDRRLTATIAVGLDAGPITGCRLSLAINGPRLSGGEGLRGELARSLGTAGENDP